MGKHPSRKPKRVAHSLVGLSVVALILAVSLANPATAQPCRQALALGLDVSGSVDAREYRLQLDGLAAALNAPDVRGLLLETPGVPVRIAIYEWSDRTFQRVISDWVPLIDDAALNGVISRLRGWKRIPAPETTGLGAALEFGADLLARSGDCALKTLDISGDGKNNDWPRPVLVKSSGVLNGIAINALVIGQDPATTGASRRSGIAELSAYFSQTVVQGPDAFVEVALGFEDYGAAMRRKLLREVATFVVGASD